jgi:methionine-rich copper-binding protein CopC
MKSRLVQSAAAIALAAVFGAPLLRAHAALERTDPKDGAMLTASPAYVQLWFSEKPDLALSSIEVTGPSGKVALGPVYAIDKALGATVKGDLAPASYKVAWQTAGDDGHVQKGEFSFMVHAH